MPILKYKINGEWLELSSAAPGGGVQVDGTLTQSGKAADAKVVGDNLIAINEVIAGVATQEFVTETVTPIVEYAAGLEGQIANKQNKVFFNNNQPADWTNGDIWLKPAE